jgi:Protein of unknown function (DUF3307)
VTQLLLHLWGDYILQSDWMATGKAKWWPPCAMHVLLYSLPFLLLHPSWRAMAVIAGTHYFIDRYRLARLVVYAKNWYPKKPEFWGTGPIHWYYKLTATGYPDGTPDFLAIWLLIIADNVLHLTINFLALRYL